MIFFYFSHFFAGSICSSNVIQPPSMETAAGTDVTLTCAHPTSNDIIQWYRLSPSQGPLFLIGGYNDIESPDKKFKLTFPDGKKSSVLLIKDVRPEDSDMYLCAQRDTELQIYFLPVQYINMYM